MSPDPDPASDPEPAPEPRRLILDGVDYPVAEARPVPASPGRGRRDPGLPPWRWDPGGGPILDFEFGDIYERTINYTSGDLGALHMRACALLLAAANGVPPDSWEARLNEAAPYDLMLQIEINECVPRAARRLRAWRGDGSSPVIFAN